MNHFDFESNYKKKQTCVNFFSLCQQLLFLDAIDRYKNQHIITWILLLLFYETIRKAR